VVLIIPPSGFLIDERVFPSLGVLKVAAALERAKVPVRVADLSGARDLGKSVDAIPDADVYGITATTPQMPAAFEIAGALRARGARKIILGGPHPTLLQASARQTDRPGHGRAVHAMRELTEAFDVIVAGDGEKAVLPAIEDSAPRMIDADSLSSDLYMHPVELEVADLPARHLIDIRSYRYRIDGLPTMSLIAQLGCPFGCVFCGGRRSPFLRKVRLRSTAGVIRELEHLYLTYGTRGFMFLDDELNVNPKFMELLGEIIRLQRQHGTEFRLRGLMKAELVTGAMAARMYEAGFRQVLIGFESGHERILSNIEKRATVADNSRCVETLKRAGIQVKALMSIGHAGETGETVRATRDWLLDVEPHDFDVTIITVYPGTPYYDDAVDVGGEWVYAAPRTGDRLYFRTVSHRVDVNFYKGAPFAYRSFVRTDALTADDLVRLRDEVETCVRDTLHIPWPTAAAARDYEHSMGMSGT
jgi:radical SAM superfamily enzyme YgiQ (UPF0313 family)